MGLIGQDYMLLYISINQLKLYVDMPIWQATGCVRPVGQACWHPLGATTKVGGDVETYCVDREGIIEGGILLNL